MVRELSSKQLKSGASQCLEYLLQHSEPGALDGSSLAETHDGELRRFDSSNEPFLLLSAAQKSVLASYLPSRVLSVESERGLGAVMTECGEQGLWQTVDCAHFVRLFGSIMPEAWKGLGQTPSLEGTEWLPTANRFW